MIIIQNITKIVSSKILFDDISFKIGDGQKVGLVGPNGVGKTTLLQIILGKEDSDSGRVICANEILGYLPQKIMAGPNTTISEYIFSVVTHDTPTYKIDGVLAEVGLKDVPKKSILHKLSGGQKMKVALAALLLQEPTTLLLDEPTNNLDLQSLKWLENFVSKFKGKVLIISHDRYFLDACVNKIIDIDAFTHKTVEYGGNYTEYTEQKALAVKNQFTEYRLYQEKEKHMKDWIAKKKEQLTYHPSTKVARQLQAMKTRFEREIERERVVKPQTYSSFSAQSLGNQLHKGKTALSLTDVRFFDLLQIPHLLILSQERVHLLGSNGSGKTTLLKAIAAQERYFSGEIEIGVGVKIGYFSQDHEVLGMHDSVLTTFMRLAKIQTESSARNILGTYLFSKEKVFSQVKFLSEGEKARLLIAIIISQGNDFLILDEPTNHLDLESREVLAKALQEYTGGFLVVSHDRYFLQQIGIGRTVEIRDQKILD